MSEDSDVVLADISDGSDDGSLVHDDGGAKMSAISEVFPDSPLSEKIEYLQEDAAARAQHVERERNREEVKHAREETHTARIAYKQAQEEAKRAREEAAKLKERSSTSSSSSTPSTVSRTEVIREYVSPTLPLFNRYSLVSSPYGVYRDELDKTLMKNEVKNQVKRELTEEMKMKDQAPRRITVRVVQPKKQGKAKSKTRSKSKSKPKPKSASKAKPKSKK